MSEFRKFILYRLRKDHPNYINVSTLLINVVSVMGSPSLPTLLLPFLFNFLIVAFIPEGLPVAVTLSLAKIAHTLSKKKILCK